MHWTDETARRLLHEMFDAAIASADAGRAVRANLPEKPKGRCIVVGAGKASAAMAAGLEAAWPDVEMSGVVVTRYGHSVETERVKIIEAAHPVPDENSVRAAVEIQNAVSGLSSEDLVIALISGGGSSLLVQPADGLTLIDKQQVNQQLLNCGASISEMNSVRAALSGVKGGRLADAASPARVETLVISDVPGDDPAAVASGPTIATPNLYAKARTAVDRYSIEIPPAARRILQTSDAPGNSCTGSVRLVASPRQAILAAQAVAARHGLNTLSLGDALEGESKELGKFMAGIVSGIQTAGTPLPAPCVLLSGGETTVTLGDQPAGKGGRNTEFLLSLAIALDGRDHVWALAADTDGIDGVEDAAGAIVTPFTLDWARDLGIDPHASLAAHDSYSFFGAVDDLIVTGPTLTNVNDFRAILVL